MKTRSMFTLNEFARQSFLLISSSIKPFVDSPLPNCDHIYQTRHKIQATGCVSSLYYSRKIGNETIRTRVCARAHTLTYSHTLSHTHTLSCHRLRRRRILHNRLRAAAYVREERERENFLGVTSGNTDFTKTTSNYFSQTME